MPYRKNLAAIILAGGQSSRMGTDKGLMPFHGQPMISHLLQTLQQLELPNIIIITNKHGYASFGYPCYPDLLEDKGPLGGIYAGMVHSDALKNLVLPCDMPFLSKDLLSALIAEIGNEEVLLTRHNGKPEPLCSVYDSRCIHHFKEKLEKNELKITDALLGLNVRLTQFDDRPWFRGNEFSNLNTPDELIKP